MTPDELARHRKNEREKLTMLARAITAMIVFWNEAYSETTGIRFTVKGPKEK